MDVLRARAAPHPIAPLIIEGESIGESVKPLHLSILYKDGVQFADYTGYGDFAMPPWNRLPAGINFRLMILD